MIVKGFAICTNLASSAMQVNQEAHIVEDSQSRLKEPPGTAGRYSRSSYQDDDGRMQGGKSIATCTRECKIVNNIPWQMAPNLHAAQIHSQCICNVEIWELIHNCYKFIRKF
jgi:hypothetical protein